MAVLQLAQMLGTSAPGWGRVELGTQRRDDPSGLFRGVAATSSLLAVGEGLPIKPNANGTCKMYVSEMATGPTEVNLKQTDRS
jgi:hypothetical protein